jgi:AraC family cel operon transcriptional repressor
MLTLTFDDLPGGHEGTYAVWQFNRHVAEPALHDHTFHELFWIEEGRGWHHVNGERRALERGSLVLVRADDVHGVACAEGERMRIVNVAFRRELWRARAARLPAEWRWWDRREATRREWRLDALRVERLRALAQDLAAGARDVVTIEAFVAGVAAMLANVERGTGGGVPEWLRAACSRLQEPGAAREGTRGFAALAGCSPAHLAREVRRHLGCTPTDMVNEARLAQAAHALVTSDATLIVVAEEAGFGNLGHFHRRFRARFGTTPHAYRRAAGERPVLHQAWRG